MSWQNGNNGRSGHHGRGPAPGAEIEEIIRQGQERLKQLISGGGARGRTGFVIVILLALAAWSAYYTVPSDSVAVIQRFGKYLKDVPPGLHFKLPFGADVASSHCWW